MKKFAVVFIYICFQITISKGNFICDENEILELCKNPCQASCQKPYVQRCAAFTCTPGCVCKLGTIWDEVSKKCVTPENCPIGCDENAEWRNCSDVLCRTCRNRRVGNNCPRPICRTGCSCKEEFIWDEQQERCVPVEQCTEPCNINQVWQRCSNIKCRETCQIPKPKVCRQMCVLGCACKNDYMWDEYYNKCVHRGSCSRVCRKNAEWHWYALGAIDTCQGLLPSECGDAFILQCFLPKPGCRCKEGFIWDQLSQECVLKNACPASIS